MTYEQMDNLQLQIATFKYVLRLRRFRKQVSLANADAQKEGHTNRFNSEFRPDASILYAELLKRTRSPRVHLVALADTILTGPDPIEEVAQELQKLAKKLKILTFRVQ